MRINYASEHLNLPSVSIEWVPQRARQGTRKTIRACASTSRRSQVRRSPSFSWMSCVGINRRDVIYCCFCATFSVVVLVRVGREHNQVARYRRRHRRRRAVCGPAADFYGARAGTAVVSIRWQRRSASNAGALSAHLLHSVHNAPPPPQACVPIAAICYINK